MSFPSSMIGAASRQFRHAKNTDAALTLVKGSAAQWDKSGTNGIDIQEPLAADGLIALFAGIMTKDLAIGDESDSALCVEGVVPCYFLNHASAAAGTWATPVTSERYLTYSSVPTGILLLTNQTSGTSETSVDASSPARVWLLPAAAREGLQAIFTVEATIADVSTASTVWAVAPIGCRLVAAYCVIAGAVTVASDIITISDGTNTAAIITVTVAGSAAGAVYTGVLDSTDANRRFTAGEKISIANGGESTDAAVGQVVLVFTRD